MRGSLHRSLAVCIVARTPQNLDIRHLRCLVVQKGEERTRKRQQARVARLQAAVAGGAADRTSNSCSEDAALDSTNPCHAQIDELAAAAQGVAEAIAGAPLDGQMPGPAALPRLDKQPMFAIPLLLADQLPPGVRVIDWTASRTPRELPVNTALSYQGVIVAIHRHMAAGERAGNAAVVDQMAEAAAELGHGLPAEKHDVGDTGKTTYHGWRWERRSGGIGV
jgi:hypothetical protein